MHFNLGKKRVLSVFTLVMINVIAIDSLRNLPVSAALGMEIIFFYIVGAVCFLLPCILVTAELATHWPKLGGAYVWVREAFGPRWGFLTIWLQWIYNVFWYPTILSFIATNLAYLVNPALAENKLFLIPIIIIMFSLATIVNSFGMKISGVISTVSAILGTILPMFLIIILSVVWIAHGKPIAISHPMEHLIPNINSVHHLAFFLVVLFSLIGLEMSAVHAEEVKNPVRDYPRALLYSGIIILVTLTLASCAIAIIVPKQSLNIIGGLDQAYSLFLSAFHLKWLLPVTIVLIILGSFGGMAAWVIGPTKGLEVAAADGCAPKLFASKTKKNVPIMILFLQWVVVLILCLLILFFHSINTWYWILTDITAQLALLFYVVLFSAAICLRKKTPLNPSAFRIPGGKFGIWLTGVVGIVTCLVAIAFGFIPPEDIPIHNIYYYDGLLIVGIVIITAIPLIMSRRKLHHNDAG